MTGSTPSEAAVAIHRPAISEMSHVVDTGPAKVVSLIGIASERIGAGANWWWARAAAASSK